MGDWRKQISFGDPKAWERTSDAYGSAKGVPKHLRKLMSGDEGARKDAIWALYGNIFHQGGRFHATLYAIDPLYDMLAHPDCPSRSFILRYLVNLALGYEEEYFPFGAAPAKHIAALEDYLDGKSIRQVEFYCDPYIALDLYEKIQSRRSEIIPHIADQSPPIAISAMYAAAFLCPDEPTARKAVVSRLNDRDQDVRCATYFTLALMDRCLDRTDRLDEIAPALNADDRLERFAAATAIAEAHTIHDLREPLVYGLAHWASPRGKDERSQVLRETWWSQATFIAIDLIREYVTEPTETWIDAFAVGLRGASAMSGVSIAAALIRFITPKGVRTYKDLPASALTPMQRRGLEVLREHGIWSLNGDMDGQFLNWSTLLRNFGLPETRDTFKAYLEGR